MPTHRSLAKYTIGKSQNWNNWQIWKKYFFQFFCNCRFLLFHCATRFMDKNLLLRLSHRSCHNRVFGLKPFGLTSKRGNQQSVPVVHQELEGLFALIDKTPLDHGYLPSLCVGIEKTRQASGYILVLLASSN